MEVVPCTGRPYEICGGPSVVVVAEPSVHIFNSERPVRGKAVLQTNADRTTPARIGCCGEIHAVPCGPSIVFGDGGTALDIEQSVVRGITDAAGEQAKSINLCTNRPSTGSAVV